MCTLFQCYLDGSEGLLIFGKFGPISSTKPGSWISADMPVYQDGNLEFKTQAFKLGCMQHHCWYSKYHESHLTWNPMAHHEGAY